MSNNNYNIHVTTLMYKRKVKCIYVICRERIRNIYTIVIERNTYLNEPTLLHQTSLVSCLSFVHWHHLPDLLREKEKKNREREEGERVRK